MPDFRVLVSDSGKGLLVLAMVQRRNSDASLLLREHIESTKPFLLAKVPQSLQQFTVSTEDRESQRASRGVL